MNFYPCNFGGGISNSKVIRDEGKYALDAVQNNPDVDGSLRSEIESASGKIDTHIVNAWNNFSVIESAGYIHLVRIKISNIHIDYPLSFTVNGRGFIKPANLKILFHDADNADTDINKCTTDLVTFDYNYKFYIAKETTSTWNIYVNHIPYTSIAIIEAKIFKSKSADFFQVTYPNVLVDSLPDGSLEFTTE